MSYSLYQFSRELVALKHCLPKVQVRRAQKLLKQFIQSQPFSLQKYIKPTQGEYLRYRLSDEKLPLHIVLSIWGPKSVSPIHDHNGLTGVVGVIRGTEVERKYQIIKKKENLVQLKEVKLTEMKEGSVSSILPNEKDQLHAVENRSTTEYNATLHVYLQPLITLQKYLPSETVKGWYDVVTRELWFDKNE